jgi:hypothetical protein
LPTISWTPSTSAVALANASPYNGALFSDLADARGYASVLAGELALDRALVLCGTRSSARTLAGARRHVKAFASTIARGRALVRADDLVRALDCAHACVGDLVKALDLADSYDLVSASARSSLRVSSGHRVPAPPQQSAADDETPQRRSPAVRITLSASGLVSAAAWLLPAADRPRYCEEYRSELWDLASVGAGRRQQLRYGARQLLRVAPLRVAVLAPRRRNAAP